MTRLRQRSGAQPAQAGFTLVELLVVLAIIGILLAIAIPSYFLFRGRAEDTVARANVRAAVPSAEAFFSDNGTYTGLSLTTIRTSYDSGIDRNLTVVVGSGGTTYCLSEPGQTGVTWYVSGPGGKITSTRPSGC